MAAILCSILSPGAATARPQARAAVPAGPVTVSVSAVDPLVPAATDAVQPLTLSVTLTNTSDQPVTSVMLSAERGDPIGNAAALTTSMADPAARTGGIPVTGVPAAPLTLAPHAVARTTFRTTTSRQDKAAGLCLCAPASIYPLDLSVTGTTGGITSTVGGTRTYLPSFDTTPAAAVGVTWVWPLVDRPHRTAGGTVFTDDALASSVAAGGRLDRALEVVERVAGTVPLTLVVDPELLDELQTMAVSAYTVRSTPAARAVAGTGRTAAAQWLARLRAVLDAHADLTVQLTPLADPDVTGLAQHARTWTTALSATVARDVATALGRALPSTTLAWPPTASATPDVLDALSASGISTVLLNGAQLRPAVTDGFPVSVARLPTRTGSVTAVATAPVLQGLAGSALTGSQFALSRLLSELAVRVAQQPQQPPAAVLAAPLYVDPSPAAAALTIVRTSTSVFTRPVAVADAAAAVTADSPASTLGPVSASPYNLSDELLEAAGSATDHLQATTSLIGGSVAGREDLADLPDQVQRTESAAWSPAGAGIGGGSTAGSGQHDAIRTALARYLGGVRILPPSSGSYTLASSSAPLPISVRNDLGVPVQVTLDVTTVGGLPGFSARDTAVHTIAPNSKATIQVSTRIQRSGRIPVEARLRTPSNYPLGSGVMLSVHSTALGVIGIVITVVSGVVLVLALLIRFARRVRRRRRAPGPRTPPRTSPGAAPAERETVS